MSNDDGWDTFAAGFTRSVIQPRTPRPPKPGPSTERGPRPRELLYDELIDEYVPKPRGRQPRPKSLSRRGTLERASLTTQYRAACERLRALKRGPLPVPDGARELRQVILTADRLRRQAITFGISEAILDAIHDDRPTPLTGRLAPAERPIAPLRPARQGLLGPTQPDHPGRIAAWLDQVQLAAGRADPLS